MRPDAAGRWRPPRRSGCTRKRVKDMGGAREHITFGGALTERTPGLIAHSMVRHGKGGDFRNPERIRRWAHHIGAQLAPPP